MIKTGTPGADGYVPYPLRNHMLLAPVNWPQQRSPEKGPALLRHNGLGPRPFEQSLRALCGLVEDGSAPPRHEDRLPRPFLPGRSSHSPFKALTVDPGAHEKILSGIQRLRGKAYLADGALQPHQLTPDGRHCQPMDRDSWHLVAQDDGGNIVSCARYYPIPDPRFELTVASHSALAKSPEWRSKVVRAVESAIDQAAGRGASFVEFGGWCVAPELRNSGHALRTVLLMFALGEILGGAVGLSTATKRHSSSSILQRLGAHKAGANGELLPAYFEPSFDCEMELLQFDSLRPAKKYAAHVATFGMLMPTEMRVICHGLPEGTAVPQPAASKSHIGNMRQIPQAIHAGAH